MNPTKNGTNTPPFNEFRDNWLKVKAYRDNSDKRIKSKLTLIESRQKRLQKLQRTLQGDIEKLKAEIVAIEQSIPLLNLEMQEAQTAMALSFGGDV